MVNLLKSKGLKLLSSSILIIALIANPSYAALATYNVWEVRTTGSDDNGGCAESPTVDYTQQDAAELTLTDLATSGVGVTTLTSVTGGFTSNMVGNCINIKSGTNLGTTNFFEITAHTDTNTVTLDRAPDDGGGGLASGTGSVGGGLATITKAESERIGRNIVYIKAGTYTETLTINGGAGNTSDKTRYIGYNSTRDDEPKGANRPLIDSADTRANCININGNYDQFFFAHLVCQDSTGDGITGSSLSGGHLFYNVRSTSNTGDGFSTTQGASCFYCEADNNGALGSNGLFEGPIYGTYIHDNTGKGMDTSDGATIEFTIADTNGGTGIETGNTSQWLNSISYNNTGRGFHMSDNTTGAINRAWNNISKDNSSPGFERDGGKFYIFDYNIYHNDTLSQMDAYIDDNNLGDVDPSFTNAAAGDFTLSASSSPATAAGNEIGKWSSLNGTYIINVGPDQDDNTVGGGGSVTVGYGF